MINFSDASRSKKVENRARTRILDFQIFENENAENFLDSKNRESRIKMTFENFSRETSGGVKHLSLTEIAISVLISLKSIKLLHYLKKVN